MLRNDSLAGSFHTSHSNSFPTELEVAFDPVQRLGPVQKQASTLSTPPCLCLTYT
jgi:hypothetical protein